MKRLDGNEKRLFNLPAMKGEEIDAQYDQQGSCVLLFFPLPFFLQLPFGLVMDCVYTAISKEKSFFEDKVAIDSYAFLFVIVF